MHRAASKRIKEAAKVLGLHQIPLQDSVAANGMTALYFPRNVTAGDLIPRLLKRGVVVAGGLHVEIKGQFEASLPLKLVHLYHRYKKETYFRIGHMGISAVDISRGDIDKIIRSLGEALQEIKEEKGLIH